MVMHQWSEQTSLFPPEQVCQVKLNQEEWMGAAGWFSLLLLPVDRSSKSTVHSNQKSGGVGHLSHPLTVELADHYLDCYGPRFHYCSLYVILLGCSNMLLFTPLEGQSGPFHRGS